jgi:D-alanine transaminase
VIKGGREMTIYDHVLTENDFVHQNDLRYPFEERGLQFGDGIYEVIRVYGGSYYLIDEHVERLYRSAEAVKIEVPYKKEQMYTQLDELLNKNQIRGDAKVYLQITRGSAPRDHAFPTNTDANLYAYVKDLPRATDKMLEGVETITQHDVRWDWCYIKSLNLLPNVLAKQAAAEKGCYEAVLHKDGEVTEKNILHGCVRIRIEEFCKQEGIPFIEESFRLEDFQYADEVFLTSSTSEVMPILKVDELKIGEGKPGDVTRKLQELYEEDAGIPADQSIFKKNVEA